jgi:hypothetical protein
MNGSTLRPSSVVAPSSAVEGGTKRHNPERGSLLAQSSWASTARRARGASVMFVALFALFIRTRDARDRLAIDGLPRRRRDSDTMFNQKRDHTRRHNPERCLAALRRLDNNFGLKVGTNMS